MKCSGQLVWNAILLCTSAVMCYLHPVSVHALLVGYNLQNQTLPEIFPWQFCFHFHSCPEPIIKPPFSLFGRWILSSLVLNNWWFIIHVIEARCTTRLQSDLWVRCTQYLFHEELLSSVIVYPGMHFCRSDGNSEPQAKLLIDKISFVSSWPSVFL